MCRGWTCIDRPKDLCVSIFTTNVCIYGAERWIFFALFCFLLLFSQCQMSAACSMHLRISSEYPDPISLYSILSKRIYFPSKVFHLNSARRNSIIHNHFFDVIAFEWWHPNLLRTNTLGWLRSYFRFECKRQKKNSKLASHIWRDESFVHSRRLDIPSTLPLCSNNAQVSCNKLKCRHCSLFSRSPHSLEPNQYLLQTVYDAIF